MMPCRKLGKTGIEVTPMGFGAWPIGGVAYGEVAARQQGLDTLAAYVDRGGNFIDTARRYGVSETLIGQFVKERGNRDELVIASKTHQLEEANIRAELETTLSELQTDWVDLYYLHNPPEDPEQMQRTLDVFVQLKKEGKIRAIGSSIKGPDVTQHTVDLCRQYIATGKVDALQVIYSIFRQKNAEMFAEANAAGVGIVARTVLESGFLTGKYRAGHVFREGDHRLRWGRERLDAILADVECVEKLAVKPPYKTLAQAAMRFACDAEGVASIIPGAKTPEQAHANMDAGELPPMDPALREQVIEPFAGRTEEFNTSDL